MLQAGTTNLSAYARKMMIDGYIIRSDFSEIRRLIRVLRGISTNINQIAMRANSTRSIYKEDVDDLRADMKELKIACMDHLIALIEKD